jgi:hypothetical protein
MKKAGLKICNKWDEDFFQEFVKLKNTVYKNQKLYLLETLEDFEKLIGPEGIFSDSYHWSAYIITNDLGLPQARFFLTYPKKVENQVTFVSLGYFESKDKKIGEPLFGEALKNFYAQFGGVLPPTIRGPVQFNFFNGYRLKTGGKSEPTFNEPVQPQHYQNILSSWGFKPKEGWETYKIDTTETFDKNWQVVEKKWNDSGLKIRSINLKKWKSELKNVFKLLKNSYSNMSEFSDMSWESFYLLYKDLRYIIQPEFFLLAENSEGDLKAFTIGFVDPLPLLVEAQNKIIKRPYLKILYKLQLLKKLKSRRGQLMVPYIGKARGDRSTTWVTAAFGHFIGLAAAKRGIDSCLLCYNSSKGAMKRLLPSNLEVVSEYKIYELVYEPDDEN